MATNPTPPASPAQPEQTVPERLLRLIREQGVAQTATFEHLLGSGRGLWADDEEFERFLAGVEATRHEKG